MLQKAPGYLLTERSDKDKVKIIRMLVEEMLNLKFGTLFRNIISPERSIRKSYVDMTVYCILSGANYYA